VLIVFLDPIAKTVAEKRIRDQTGLGVKIGKVSIGLRTPTLAIENFKLTNSPAFGGSIFIDLPEVQLRYDLRALRSRKIHLNVVRLNLAQLHIVQNKDGKTNLQAVQERQKRTDSGAVSNGSTDFQGIDTLKLTVGKLKFTSVKDPARNEEAYVGIRDETITDVKSMKDLQPLIGRISLEKGLKFLSENLSGPGTNPLQNVTQSAEPDTRKNRPTP